MYKAYWSGGTAKFLLNPLALLWRDTCIFQDHLNETSKTNMKSKEVRLRYAKFRRNAI